MTRIKTRAGLGLYAYLYSGIFDWKKVRAGIRAVEAEASEAPETRPCTVGKDGRTCDGTDHVQHLVWSCFTATELGAMRDRS